MTVTHSIIERIPIFSHLFGGEYQGPDATRAYSHLFGGVDEGQSRGQEQQAYQRACRRVLHRRYKAIVGALDWRNQGTRPDISHAYSELSRFVQCPGKSIWTLLNTA